MYMYFCKEKQFFRDIRTLANFSFIKLTEVLEILLQKKYTNGQEKNVLRSYKKTKLN